ncbi:cytochrome oxidase putative small subunit CydP [Pseudomonas panipatensis]|uniref:cytochrome oxidase putative small subunit CydP n=1 Tax=Pseudomonas panipatensis TaxID=428992 RepID=UPI00313A4B4B
MKALRPSTSSLARELALVIVLKTLLLGLLWWAFFDGQPRLARDVQTISTGLLDRVPASSFPARPQ